MIVHGKRVFNVLITNTGERYACPPTHNLLTGMEQLGRKGIPVGCRGGGCGVCKVHITSGKFHAAKMSRQHISVEDVANGVVLACRATPESDICLSVVGKMVKQFHHHRVKAHSVMGSVGINASLSVSSSTEGGK